MSAGSAEYNARDNSTMYNAPGGSITIYEARAAADNGPSIPHWLPQPPGVFVNRDSELLTLRHLLDDPSAAQRRTVVVLSGPGGVGKTGLALYWANEVRSTVLRELADLYRLWAGADNPESIDQAIDAYREAERGYEELSSENGLASLRLALADAYLRKGDELSLEEAERCIRGSLAYGRQLNEKGAPQHPRLKGYALRHLGDLYRRRGDFREAISSYEESASTFSDAKDPISEGRARVQLGQTLAEYCQHLIARSRSEFTDAAQLLSPFPNEVRTIGSWLSRLNSMPPVIDGATSPPTTIQPTSEGTDQR